MDRYQFTFLIGHLALVGAQLGEGGPPPAECSCGGAIATSVIVTAVLVLALGGLAWFLWMRKTAKSKFKLLFMGF